MPKTAKTNEERFWANVDRKADEDCWLWTGCQTGHHYKERLGYGVLSISGKPYYAHRFAWELTNGAIPDGMFVCHHCDHPSCVNPSHLFLGTPMDNTRDMVEKGRYKAPFGEDSVARKAREARAAKIRDAYLGGETIYGLTQAFGLSTTTICEIIVGKIWRRGVDESYLVALRRRRAGFGFEQA